MARIGEYVVLQMLDEKTLVLVDDVAGAELTLSPAQVEALDPGELLFEALCVKPSGHVEDGDPVHACDAGCGGKWSGTYEGEGGNFKVVEYPTGRGEGLPR